MMIPQEIIENFIKEYHGASKAELKANLKRLTKRNQTREVQAEIKAIQALLA